MSLWDNRSHIKTIENVIATVTDWFVRPPSALEARAAATLRDELRQLSGNCYSDKNAAVSSLTFAGNSTSGRWPAPGVTESPDIQSLKP